MRITTYEFSTRSSLVALFATPRLTSGTSSSRRLEQPIRTTLEALTLIMKLMPPTDTTCKTWVRLSRQVTKKSHDARGKNIKKTTVAHLILKAWSRCPTRTRARRYSLCLHRIRTRQPLNQEPCSSMKCRRIRGAIIRAGMWTVT